MTTETYELLSDIVKIMGGASIAGIFALFQSLMKNRKESKVFIREYNVTRLEKSLDYIDTLIGLFLNANEVLEKCINNDHNIEDALKYNSELIRKEEPKVSYVDTSIGLTKNIEAKKSFNKALNIMSDFDPTVDVQEIILTTDEIINELNICKEYLIYELKDYTQKIKH